MSGQLQPPPHASIELDADLYARFERRCRRDGKDPREVLEALVHTNLDARLKR